MPLSYKDTFQPLAEPVTLAQAKAQCVVDTGYTADDGYLAALVTASRQYVEKVLQRAIFPRGMQLFLDFFPYPDSDGTINPNDRHCLYGYFWHALAIRLPRPRALSVQSITYIDLSGTLQTFNPALYYLDANSEPGRIVPQPGIYWPYTQSWLPGSVTVSYTAGGYVNTVAAENVIVSATAPYNLPLKQIGSYVGMLSLVDAGGNPVVWTDTPGNVLTGAGPTTAVAASYAGQTLTASYYTASCPMTIQQAMLLLISHWYSNREAASSAPPKEIDLGVQNLLAGEIFETFGF